MKMAGLLGKVVASDPTALSHQIPLRMATINTAITMGLQVFFFFKKKEIKPFL
mgnify:CR=1 FL=1